MTQKTSRNETGGLGVAVFCATIFVSAFLLFQVQPLVSKAILPWFGGCPAVWTTCMLFFQTLLFGGYLYAHLLQTRLAARYQAAFQLFLVLAAVVVLPILPSDAWKPADSSNPTWQILLLLSATVGLPYFALSATSPLVQAWFGSAYPNRSPYRMYSLSNAGSLIALLTYPFVFEPAFDSPTQAMLWSGTFLCYAALCAACLACTWRLTARQTSTASDQAGATTAPTWFDRFAWIALPACASLMLLAGTNHICQDVAVVPFLWVVPLSLYLLSFIICFDHSRWYIRWLWAGATVLELVGVAAIDHLKQTSHRLTLSQELTLNLAALFFVFMVCHGELARRKPNTRYLTEFYLMIAAGGALGGLFVCVAAPLIFTTYFEWQLGMALSALLACGLLIVSQHDGKKRLFRYLLAAPAAVGLWYLASWEFNFHRSMDQARNFFGAVAVDENDADDPEKHHLFLKHGRITHGRQYVAESKRRWPTSYYGRQSGLGLTFAELQKAGPIRVGAVGLGIGTVAAYLGPDDYIRFYEINPEVLRMARTHFTYLADCRGKSDVVLGDARLSLDAEPPQKFNILIVDAFSGDAIPTHLLTREAFDIYMRHLAPNGAIAVHISNNYLNLAPVVRRLAEYCKMDVVRVWNDGDDDQLVDGSNWMLVTKNENVLREGHAKAKHSAEEDDTVVPLWTDQYSNLFRILSSD